jgi:hypothetical protein
MWLCVRYVNYTILHDGRFSIEHGDKLITQNVLLSVPGYPHEQENNRNQVAQENNRKQVAQEIWPSVYPARKDAFAQGMEDVRLFVEGDQLAFVGTNVDHAHNGQATIFRGVVDIEDTAMIVTQAMLHQVNEPQKNWIPVRLQNETMWIYQWWPLRIGMHWLGLGETIVPRYHFIMKNQPRWMQTIRGSTITIPFSFSSCTSCTSSCLLCLVHYAEDRERQPRIYVHVAMILDANTAKPLFRSQPFVFKQWGIEYCIGMYAVPSFSHLYCFVSQNDSNPVLIEIATSSFIWYPIESEKVDTLISGRII